MDCETESAATERSARSIALGNVPYVLMLLLGALIIATGLGSSPTTWLAAGGYVAYGVLGALWLILFLCPYCPMYGDRSCPCGYGVVSARLRARGDASLFVRKFRLNIPVIVPLWIIPLPLSALALYQSISPAMLILTGLFVVHSFLILPYVSRRHGCQECSQRDVCPWMQRDGRKTETTQ